MKYVLCSWLVLLACRAPSTTSVHSDSTANEKRIERIAQGLLPPVIVKGEATRWTIEERMREHKIPAVSIAVFENYELQWAKAYGMAEAETGTRATEETNFLAGSISKSVNALGVVLAAADGTLALDQPINELLESWKLPENELTRATPVTIRMLLSHSAGTTVHGFPGYAAGGAIPTVQQILDGEQPANTAAVRVDLAPGTRFRYSGGGTTITQVALADRSKRPYAEVLAARVLGPLGMKNSTFEQALPPERLQHAAAGYGRDGQVIEGKRHSYPEMAAAGLWTTASDLARFFVELARARAGKSSKIAAEIATQMTTKVIQTGDDPDGDTVGLGVFLSQRNGARFFGHGGADAGFQASALASLDGGYGVIIMANSENGFGIFGEIERAVFKEYGWPGAEPEYVRVALDPEKREQLLGHYVLGDTQIAISEQEGKIVARAPFEPPSELVPIGTDRLIHCEKGLELRVVGAGSLDVRRPRGPQRTLTRMPTVTRIPEKERHPLFELEAGNFEAAAAVWRERLKASPNAANQEEDQANLLGYQVMERDPAKAVELLRLVATVFPQSSNAHDSLGEAYLKVGDKARAIAEYEQSLKLIDADSRVPAAEKATRRSHAQEQLAKLRAAK